MTKPNITPELIRAALAHIPAALARDEWARIAMAIKSEYPDSTGRDLFTDWSAKANGFDPKATASTWRSVKGSGGVSIGTLLHLAKENGFTLPKLNQATAAPSPEALAQREREREANQQRERARIEADHERAAIDAVAMFGNASDTGDSAYLARKAVQPHGVRFAPDGWLLVPVRDAAGKLCNLQRIAPAKPTDGGTDKLFLKGGRKSGLWHWCGDLGNDPAGPAVVLVAEGYATAASVHEATGRPVAVAFDAGNLAHVARALRNQYPAALLVLCGDDDRDTEARTGSNPGKLKATSAAKVVQGLAVFPEGLPAGASDFNDLQAAAGLDAVRACIESAIQAHQTQQTNALATQADKATKGRKTARTAQPGSANDTPDSGRAFDRFHTDDEGVWFTPPGDDGGMPRKVCGPLRVAGLARDGNDNQAALVLEFDTPYRDGRRWLMPLSMLAGDGAAFRSALLSQGFMTPTDAKRRGWLTEYLQSRPPAELVRHVPRVGWHGRCYVLPEETLGTNPSGDRVIFHSEAGIEPRISIRARIDVEPSWEAILSRLRSQIALLFATKRVESDPKWVGSGRAAPQVRLMENLG